VGTREHTGHLSVTDLSIPDRIQLLGDPFFGLDVLVDTNIWLDILLVREPLAAVSAKALSLLDAREHGIFVGATTVTTLFYLHEKAKDRTTARSTLRSLLDRTRVAPVDGDVLRHAWSLDFDDYEVAVLHGAAEATNLDAILTRDARGFSAASLRIYAPDELVAALR